MPSNQQNVPIKANINKQRELVNSARKTRDTTTETWFSYGNSTWHASKYRVHKTPPQEHPLCTFEGVPLADFTYTVFTRKPSGATVVYSGLRCCVLCPLSAVNALWWFYTGALGLILFQTTTRISTTLVAVGFSRSLSYCRWLQPRR